jgi:hypothetical protein
MIHALLFFALWICAAFAGALLLINAAAARKATPNPPPLVVTRYSEGAATCGEEPETDCGCHLCKPTRCDCEVCTAEHWELPDDYFQGNRHLGRLG